MKVFFDSSQEQQLRQDIEGVLPLAVLAVNIFNELPIGKIETIKDLKHFIEDMDGFIISKLPNNPKLAGIPISRERFAEMLELPTDKLKQLRFENKAAWGYLPDVCEFDKAGALVVDEKKLQGLIDDRCYTHLTDKQAKAYKDYLALCKQLGEFEKKHNIHHAGFMNMQLKQIAKFEFDQPGVLEPRQDFFQRHLR